MVVKETLEKYFVIRTSWVFGKNGNNFVKKILELGKTKGEINVVNDQIGSPTYAKDLAVLICDMLQTTHYGTYNAANEGYCSRYDFALKIFELAGINIRVNPIPTSEYPDRARRPLNSRMSKEMLDKHGFNRLPHWEDALKRYLDELSN